MADANTYGVTASTLQAYVSDLEISPASSPSTTQVGEIIQAEANSLRGHCAARGIQTDGMVSTDPTYGVLANILTYRAVAIVLRARNRGIDAEGIQREAAFELKRLMDAPQTVDEDNTSTLAESTRQYRERVGSRVKGASRTAAGRIISGGSI